MLNYRTLMIDYCAEKLFLIKRIIMFRKLVVGLALVFLLSGCTTIPMPSYVNQPIASSNYSLESNTMESVEKSIVRAGVSLGWIVKKRSDGELAATLNIRSHQLSILITHDTETLSVQYLDSKNLKYKNGKIHRQYANWVTNLIRTINANIIVN